MNCMSMSMKILLVVLINTLILFFNTYKGIFDDDSQVVKLNDID